MAGAHETRGAPAIEPGGRGEHAHPTWKTYVLIGAILTVITAAEVAVFYIPALRPVLVPILLTLSGVKFALVVMFYMHLKFDAPVFRSVFLAPFVLAVFVVVALVVLFHVLPAYGPGG
jgi:heme/copper-type cytochrome/quinol oxidase subunit 4